jgi:transposase InsO family protein
VIRREHGVSVRRFCELARIPTSTWYRRRARALGGQLELGPWPRPVRDRVAAAVHARALAHPAWGHRKIWALTVADGHRVSMRTVHRILDERGLLHGRRYQAERRDLARARRAAFHTPPQRRNAVWQLDFSEYETTAGGIWQLGGVVDYVTKYSLGCPVSATKTWRDAVAALDSARQRAEEALGHPLIEDVVDRATGELHPVRVVTDNGACFRARGFTSYIRSRPELEHVRTRHRAPQTNGVIERWFQALKYEHLYLHEIADGSVLAELVAGFQTEFNTIRPHQALDWARPADRYLATPGPRPDLTAASADGDGRVKPPPIALALTAATAGA